MNIKRVILIVMDGCGAGTAPDAELFGDVGVNAGNTLANLAARVGGLKVPHLRKLGLGNAVHLAGGPPEHQPVGCFGRLREKSLGGKDTVTGHWEMMGIVTARPFPTYPKGFPPEVIEAFSQAIGCPVLGNLAASGTEILKKLGQEHEKTGHPIVYTSADSVFQIACHEEVVPVERLYEMCRTARGLLTGAHAVQRVIARPFEGTGPEGYRRTERRKDFPLSPPANVLDSLQAAGVRVGGIGVVPEVFDGRGFYFARRTQSNQEHYQALLEAMETDLQFLFVNFEDFDMLYGHRNDCPGFAAALETFDGYVGHLMGRMTAEDLLLITADHGNDPTTPSTDHSREYVPLLLYSPLIEGGTDYGIRETMADIGATVAHVFGVERPAAGHTLL